MTLDEWAETCWSTLVVRERTLLDYRRKYRKNIAPHLGAKELTAITRMEVQAWVLKMTPTVGRACLPIIKTLYREALAYGMVEINPTVGVRRKPHIPPRRDFWTLDKIMAADFGSHTEMFRFMAKHGLRWSEVMNLTDDDFIWVNNRQYVRVVRSEGGNVTKSRKPRLVPYNGHWSPDYPRNYKWARHVFQRQTDGLTIHSLRKTYAYWLKQRGVSMQVAQKLLGHSTITLTMDLYTDVMQDELENAAELLADSDG